MSAWLSEWIQANSLFQCMFLGNYLSILVYEYERHVYLLYVKTYVCQSVMRDSFCLKVCIYWS